MNRIDEKKRKKILVILVCCIVLVYVLSLVNFSKFHPIQINEFGERAAEIGLWLIIIFTYGILFSLIGVFMSKKRKILRIMCRIYGTTLIFAGVIMAIITVAQLLL